MSHTRDLSEEYLLTSRMNIEGIYIVIYSPNVLVPWNFTQSSERLLSRSDIHPWECVASSWLRIFIIYHFYHCMVTFIIDCATNTRRNWMHTLNIKNSDCSLELCTFARGNQLWPTFKDRGKLERKKIKRGSSFFLFLSSTSYAWCMLWNVLIKLSSCMIS